MSRIVPLLGRLAFDELTSADEVGDQYIRNPAMINASINSGPSEAGPTPRMAPTLAPLRFPPQPCTGERSTKAFTKADVGRHFSVWAANDEVRVENVPRQVAWEGGRFPIPHPRYTSMRILEVTCAAVTLGKGSGCVSDSTVDIPNPDLQKSKKRGAVATLLGMGMAAEGTSLENELMQSTSLYPASGATGPFLSAIARIMPPKFKVLLGLSALVVCAPPGSDSAPTSNMLPLWHPTSTPFLPRRHALPPQLT